MQVTHFPIRTQNVTVVRSNHSSLYVCAAIGRLMAIPLCAEADDSSLGSAHN